MKVQEEKIEIVLIDDIDDNPFQTRSHYGRKDLDELTASIDEHGLRQIPEARRVGDRVQLAYGHLRKRAIAKLCKKKPKKWTGMPLRIKDLSDEDMFYFALEENMRRRDVTPIDVANSVETFLTKFPEKTETEVAKKLNMTQANISNMRRVLRLPAKVLEKVEEGKINFTMGRELLLFQGRARGRSMHTQQELTEEFLMVEAIKGLITEGVQYSYGHPRTVDGIKKSMFQVARAHFPKLYNEGTSYSYSIDPLFDVEAAGCLKCEKMIRCHETKAQTRPFCTDRTCWEDLRKKHQADQAKETKRQMDAEMQQRAAEMAVQMGAQAEGEAIAHSEPEDISQEIPDATQSQQSAGTAEPPKIEPKNGKKSIPKALLKQAKEAAGTRAVMLDMEDIREGHWGLKQGYVQLNNELHRMDDPQECTERCIKGFHYAYDSRHGVRHDGDLYHICDDPKCVGRKKAAFTRNRNADGAAKKKAETKAIADAVAATTSLDVPRLVLLIHSSIEGNHVSGHHWGNTWSSKKWWWDKVMGSEFEHNVKLEDMYRKLGTFPEEKISGLLVQFGLDSLRYEGELLHYKVKTTEALNRLNVGVSKITPEMTAQIGSVEGSAPLVTDL